ncbi:pathogenicity island 1 effector protein StpP [Salmonella enterica subsp. enterica]|uniref:Pathogenicity island 1 effector protein StpP n=1 Tax=Salmonella enterica I TaxID=59201 RepID=A0A379UV40_SALET|nr:pathogenicity island 1 effector protein StpP [Salmonella enterica subsp. enterica]
MPQTMSGPTLGLARFAVSSIPINQQTQVKLSDGMPVPVNTLTFDGKPVALAGSYPKNTPDALEAHMKMLLEKECSCLVVLTVGRSDAGKTITSLFQRELHLWRGAYQQPKSEFSQSGEKR